MKDCYQGADTLLPLDVGLDKILNQFSCTLEAELTPLKDCLGRILKGDVRSSIPLPPFDNSAMDGYVVRSSDLAPEGETRLPLILHRITAGCTKDFELPYGMTARIFTGAPLPKNGDTVVIQEHCKHDEGHIVFPAGIKDGANCRHAGEELVKGSLVLKSGQRLGPSEIAMAATAGHAELTTYRRLKVSVLSTGDELSPPGSSLAPGGIYDSNRYGILAALEQLGCTPLDMGVIPDKLDKIEAAMTTAASQGDLIVTSGGMSVGEEDHVKTAIENLGRMHMWRLAIKPGKPIGIGEIGTTPLIGLPGNPVSALVTLALVGRPLILKLAGAIPPKLAAFLVPAHFEHTCGAKRQEFLRGCLKTDDTGNFAVDTYRTDSSGAVSSLVQTDGLINIQQGETVQKGDLVRFIPFTSLQ